MNRAFHRYRTEGVQGLGRSLHYRLAAVKRALGYRLVGPPQRLVNALGYRLVRLDRQGIDPLADMQRLLRTDAPLILDVGANEGQSIERFKRVMPRATVRSFEPSPTTFETLLRRATGLDGVSLWNFALGSAPGKMLFLENTNSDMSSFLPLGEAGWGELKQETEVEVKTIDQFVAAERIERIDILKSDTQGYDLEVLKGAEQTICDGRIGMVYFEICLSKLYENLPTVDKIYAFLSSRGFQLVSFYEIHHHENPAGLIASWTDALFVSSRYLEDGH